MTGVGEIQRAYAKAWLLDRCLAHSDPISYCQIGGVESGGSLFSAETADSVSRELLGWGNTDEEKGEKVTKDLTIAASLNTCSRVWSE